MHNFANRAPELKEPNKSLNKQRSRASVFEINIEIGFFKLSIKEDWRFFFNLSHLTKTVIVLSLHQLIEKLCIVLGALHCGISASIMFHQGAIYILETKVKNHFGQIYLSCCIP